MGDPTLVPFILQLYVVTSLFFPFFPIPQEKEKVPKQHTSACC